MNFLAKTKQHFAVFLDGLTSVFGMSLILYFPYSERRKIFNKVFGIKKELLAEAKSQELYQIYVTVLSSSKTNGELAEVGVYKGTTAKVICEAKGQRPLHLFDTFAGLPAPGNIDKPFYKGQYKATLESVKDYLGSYPQVFFYKGLFPKTGEAVKSKKFSFVHLDVDLYKSTKAALSFFYPRLNKGGIILSHDYISSGVRKAFDEFFQNKPEPVVELPGIQCLVIKV